MEPKVTAVAAVPAPKPFENVEPLAKTATQERVEAKVSDKKKQAEAAVPQGPSDAEMRLVIEQDKASGAYVYKTINRLTGEVVSQLPRAEVLKLRNEVQYAAGDVIKTEA